jgi:DNA repair photolyase
MLSKTADGDQSTASIKAEAALASASNGTGADSATPAAGKEEGTMIKEMHKEPEAAQQPVRQDIRIADIRTDDENHPRDHIDQAAVEEYAAAMKAGVVFPDIEVYGEGGKYWLSDGRHRLEAAKLAKKASIPSKVFKGSQRDSILHSLQSNVGYGVRRSNDDKRKSVMILLKDAEWRVWNDTRIAHQCNVSQDLVASVRAGLADAGYGRVNDDGGARMVSRGGKHFMQKRKAGSKPLPVYVAAIGDMRELARKALLTMPDSDAKLGECLMKVGAELHEILGKATGAVCRLSDGLREPLNVYTHELEGGITKTPEFSKKGLATHALNVGLGCGHQCAYCSSPSLRCRLPAYGELQIAPYDQGFAIIDVETVSRIRKAMPKLDAGNTVMLSTLDDAWSPEARKYGVGRTCLESLLKETPSRIRILTKSSEFVTDLVVAKGSKDRVIVGLSTGIPASREDVAAAVEPNASTIKDRLTALKQAHDLGFATYGMLCPCLPGIADSEAALTEMFQSVLDCGVEDIWLEPLNARGKALPNTALALRLAGMKAEADAVDAIRKEAAWSQYATALVENAVNVAKKLDAMDKLHVLLYRDGFAGGDIEQLEKLGPAVIWLGKAVSKAGDDAGPDVKQLSSPGKSEAAA